MFAPEVIQTSSMDCGPAALKSLLAGHGISVSYGRLREACHTDIDGTSIDTIEEIAQRAGLSAEQVMVPEDHVVLAASRSLPAIAAVRSASGHTHFIVIWQRVGGLVQIMDPSRGRLWVSRRSLQNQLVLHSLKVSASAWREWAGSEDFLAPLRERLRAIGVSRPAQAEHIALATASSGWPELALLDAATRMVGSLQAARSVSRSAGQRTLTALLEAARQRSAVDVVPEPYWTVRPLPEGDPDSVLLKGAVLVRANGRPTKTGPREALAEAALSPELAAAFSERPSRPLRDLFAIVRTEGLAAPSIAVVALVLAVLGVVFEALLLRSAVDIGAMLKGPGQGWWAGAALAGFAGLLLTLEYILASAERRIGSHLEGRLRVAFLDKIPRLSDAYFQSRPIADMLERSHTVHTVRTLPRLAVRFARVGLELAVTTIALVWLNPGTVWVAAAAALAAAGIPLLGQSLIAERDLRTRTHAGALSRFHLDALRGRTTLEAHGAASAIEGEHDRLLTEWAASALSLQRASMTIEGAQMIAGFGLAAWMLLGHLSPGNTPALLLQAYWMLNLPALGYELALIAREYPSHRSTILRLFEPLGAPDTLERAGHNADGRREPVASQPAAVAFAFEHVSVRAGGHDILDDIHFSVASGDHVAIIGTSGAGKSTLVGLLLGWHRPSAGDVLVDGVSLTAERLDSLRRETAWVDPAVHLWNAPLLDNLLYGTGADPGAVGPVLEAAGLLPVVAKLPLGLATPLGEAGALLSAGEAQRVRFGRALLRRAPRLVVLDEPFMGLERDRRRMLLSHARQRWSEATMLYVTHDVTETRAFDRVLVVEHGRVVEDGDPRQLAHMASSRYRRLLQAHESTQNRFSGGDWRRLHLEAGRVVPGQARTSEQTA